MKLGIEVEGRFTGVPTVFCGAACYHSGIATAKALGVSHLYISDNANTIAYDDYLIASSGLLVTLDVTRVRDEPRPKNITLMLRVEAYREVSKLRSQDQVKFEDARNVLVAPVNSFYKTVPEDFADDVEL